MTNHVDDHDFRQVGGRFNQPVTPSPTFAADLRQRLSLAPEPTPVPVQPVAIQPAQPSPAARTMDDAPWRPARWMRTLEAAVAVLLVVSLAGASLYFRQPAAVYDLAFQPADKAAAEFNFGGDSGRTWDLGDVEPETGRYRMDPSIPLVEMQFADVGYSRLLIDDSLVFSASSDSGDGNLMRYDLDQSERVWRSSFAIADSQLASDGSRIFAFRSDIWEATGTARLVAIDFETGEVAWEGPKLTNDPYSSSALVISNGTLFAIDHLGNVVAVNSDDGSVIWQYPETLITASNAAPTEVPIGGEITSFTPEIVANEEAVFAGLPDRTVLKLDRESGAELGSIGLADSFGEDISYTTIQVRADRLVVAAVHAEQEPGPGDTFGTFPTNILVYDAASLELKAETALRNYGSNIVLTEEAAFFSTLMEPGSMSNVYRLDLATGELGEPLAGIQSPRGMFLSASGNTLMVTAYPSSIAFFDLDSGDLINSFDLEAPFLETPFGQPVQMCNSNPIVITGLGEVFVVTDELAAGATPGG